MNEQNMTRRKEVDLEITDFLWEIVRNWRVIAICLIIGAVLLCGYQYIKDSRNADATADEVVEEYSKTVHEMKEALGAQDLDQVYGAVAIKKQLDEKSDYADNSPLMAVNPYAENLILLQYRVQSDEGNAAELAAIYQDYLMYGELASEMIDCFNNIIHIHNFILNSNGIRFKNISGLIMGQAAAFHMIRIICQFDLNLMIYSSRYPCFLFHF